MGSWTPISGCCQVVYTFDDRSYNNFLGASPVYHLIPFCFGRVRHGIGMLNRFDHANTTRTQEVIHIIFMMQGLPCCITKETGFMTNAVRDFFLATLGCMATGLLLCPAFILAEAGSTKGWSCCHPICLSKFGLSNVIWSLLEVRW